MSPNIFIGGSAERVLAYGGIHCRYNIRTPTSAMVYMRRLGLCPFARCTCSDAPASNQLRAHLRMRLEWPVVMPFSAGSVYTSELRWQSAIRDACETNVPVPGPSVSPLPRSFAGKTFRSIWR